MRAAFAGGNNKVLIHRAILVAQVKRQQIKYLARLDGEGDRARLALINNINRLATNTPVHITICGTITDMPRRIIITGIGSGNGKHTCSGGIGQAGGIIGRQGAVCRLKSQRGRGIGIGHGYRITGGIGGCIGRNVPAASASQIVGGTAIGRRARLVQQSLHRSLVGRIQCERERGTAAGRHRPLLLQGVACAALAGERELGLIDTVTCGKVGRSDGQYIGAGIVCRRGNGGRGCRRGDRYFGHTGLVVIRGIFCDKVNIVSGAGRQARY